MPLTLRRLLNHLPFPHVGSGKIYIRSSWHKPTPFDQWTSQAPFRPAGSPRVRHFGRGLRRQRLGRLLIRGGLVIAAVWLAFESAHGLALF